MLLCTRVSGFVVSFSSIKKQKKKNCQSNNIICMTRRWPYYAQTVQGYFPADDRRGKKKETNKISRVYIIVS